MTFGLIFTGTCANNSLNFIIWTGLVNKCEVNGKRQSITEGKSFKHEKQGKNSSSPVVLNRKVQICVFRIK